MDCSTLADFRQRLYRCFTSAEDALMNTCDALLTQVGANSFPELSLSPFFVRRWPSLYEAFEDGSVDRPALRQVLADFAPAPAPPQRRVLVLDASAIVRPASPTARDRGFVHVPNLPANATPVLPGWSFSASSSSVERHGSQEWPRPPVVNQAFIPTDRPHPGRARPYGSDW